MTKMTVAEYRRQFRQGSPYRDPDSPASQLLRRDVAAWRERNLARNLARAEAYPAAPEYTKPARSCSQRAIT